MRVLLIILFCLPSASAAQAEDCLCGTDDWKTAVLEPTFAADPYLAPEDGMISVVSEHDIEVLNGECIISNTFVDTPPDAPTYTDPASDWETMKLLWRSVTGEEFFLTITGATEKAWGKCWETQPAT